VIWKVRLSAGRYTYGSALHAAHRRVLIVSS
jgi:hypothetical protein